MYFQKEIEETIIPYLCNKYKLEKVECRKIINSWFETVAEAMWWSTPEEQNMFTVKINKFGIFVCRRVKYLYKLNKNGKGYSAEKRRSATKREHFLQRVAPKVIYRRNGGKAPDLQQL